MSIHKSIRLITQSTPAQVGDGFFIRRPMPGTAIRLGEMSPFLLLDHAGPTHFEPSDTPRGVDEHPHRGFETVTILYSGEMEHRDSHGGHGQLKPGDVQWMTAGSGLVHEEKHSKAFTESGGTLELIQLWVNLPAKHKSATPKYQDIAATSIPTIELGTNGSYLRLIAGNYNDIKGAADTFTAMQLWDIRANADDGLSFDLKDGDNTALYVLSGSIQLADQQAAQEGEMVLFDTSGTTIKFTAQPDAKLLLLSGTPLNEPIASYGPFVMNRAEEIQQALQDFHTGKMGTLA
ncbi:MAG: pirin family protein [Bacteroidota bacterium]